MPSSQWSDFLCWRGASPFHSLEPLQLDCLPLLAIHTCTHPSHCPLCCYVRGRKLVVHIFIIYSPLKLEVKATQCYLHTLPFHNTHHCAYYFSVLSMLSTSMFSCLHSLEVLKPNPFQKDLTHQWSALTSFDCKIVSIIAYIHFELTPLTYGLKSCPIAYQYLNIHSSLHPSAQRHSHSCKFFSFLWVNVFPHHSKYYPSDIP